MRTSDEVGNLAKALVAFQKEVENPPNTAANPFYGSKYAPLSNILKLMRPQLTKHGLAVVQSASGNGGGISIKTMLVHQSGEWMEADPLVLTPDKLTPQGAGSAITYGRRYALSAILGISSEDDDDANAAEPEKPKAKKATNITQTAVFKKMWALAKETFPEYNEDEVKRMLHEHMTTAFGVESSKDLNADQLSLMIEWLEGWKE